MVSAPAPDAVRRPRRSARVTMTGPSRPLPMSASSSRLATSGNVAPLIDRLGRALAGHAAEILFVDDSDDETPAGARSAQGGLGGAVLAGIQATDAAWVVVMDGNLQHPPEVVPELLHEGEEFDIVVASRYCGDGAADWLSSRYRELVSASASASAPAVARLAFPRRLARVTDPLSGFFAVRVAALDAASLRPQGFKILLEILRRSPRTRVGELVPFRGPGTGQERRLLAGSRPIHPTPARSNRLPLSAAVPETDGVSTEARRADDGSPGPALVLSEVKAEFLLQGNFPGRDRHSDHGELI
jgi:hypothetical protein